MEHIAQETSDWWNIGLREHWTERNIVLRKDRAGVISVWGNTGLMNKRLGKHKHAHKRLYDSTEPACQVLSETYTYSDSPPSSFQRLSSYVPLLLTKAVSPTTAPAASPSRGGDVTVYVWHKLTELAHSFLFCSCVSFCLYGPFNCLSFHKFSRQLSVFSLCSCSLSSALLVLSTIYLFMKAPPAHF